MSRAMIDKLLGKWFSRKLFVFLISCGFVGFGLIDGEAWVQIASFYIGGQATVDTIKAWKS